jgi:hypothetical protein
MLSRKAGAAQRSILETYAEAKQCFVIAERGFAALAGASAQSLEIGKQFDCPLDFVGQRFSLFHGGVPS